LTVSTSPDRSLSVFEGFWQAAKKRSANNRFSGGDTLSAEPERWGSFGHLYYSLTGYNFLSLSLALGILKHQSRVARAALLLEYTISDASRV
jgi:hypothetical protein